MPKAYPLEFRRDVVALARHKETSFVADRQGLRADRSFSASQ